MKEQAIKGVHMREHYAMRASHSLQATRILLEQRLAQHAGNNTDSGSSEAGSGAGAGAAGAAKEGSTGGTSTSSEGEVCWVVRTYWAHGPAPGGNGALLRLLQGLQASADKR